MNWLPGSWRRAWDRWWQSRQPPRDEITLTQRNVYILPTPAGWMLAVTLLVLLLASINYQLNLGYLLTFSLAGSSVVGMHLCHATLRGLTLRLVPPPPQFCGANALLDVQLIHSGKSTRHAISVGVYGAASAGHDSGGAWTDVPPQGSSTVQLAFQPQQRGLQALPTLTAQTRFPMGTFRAWTLWRPASRLMVYPAPEAAPPPLPHGQAQVGSTEATHKASTSGEFDGVRPYQRGDTLRQIVWKKTATAFATGSDALVSRDTATLGTPVLWLDYRQSGAIGLEQQLSRLCAWVLQADRLGLQYGLRLPACEIAPASGAAHRQQCLEALALC